MKLTEDIAKRLLRDSGLPVPEGGAVERPEAAAALAGRLGGAVAVKALVPAGRRGKSGLVRLCPDPDAAAEAAASILGADSDAGRVERVYIEAAADIDRELYLSLAFGDRAPLLTVSCAGGVEIETVHAETPEKVVTVAIDPIAGLRPWEAIEAWSAAGLTGRPLAAVGRLTARLWQVFTSRDALMLEVNPLSLDANSRPALVGAMIEIDDDALDRHQEFADAPGRLPANPRERAVVEANRAHPGGDARYTELDGDIGLLVAGGGAGLLQHDLIVDMGGHPANHSDISPAPGPWKIEAVLDAIFANPKARGLLVGYNFLQMAPCDQVAEALAACLERNGVDTRAFPVVVRLFGPRQDRARELLSGFEGLTYLRDGAGLEEGARAVVDAVRAAPAREVAR